MSERRIPIHPDHSQQIADDAEKRNEIVKCAKSFRHFLTYWYFVDARTGRSVLLGNEPWAGQSAFITEVETHDWVYSLKARKLGISTISIAYCAWIARFGQQNSRIHLFSRREDAAVELLDGVKHGLRRLPAWMKLPVGQVTQRNYELIGEENDRRLVKCYPTNPDTAVEATSNHSLLDEFARMPDNILVWQALEPTFAGSCHLVTTGQGPTNFAATLWRQAKAGDNRFHPFFSDALQRPDRSMAWLRAKEREMPRDHVRQEYPMTEEEALAGTAQYKFSSDDVEWCERGKGETEFHPAHRYIKSWDIGRHQDAAVGIVLDISTSPMEVVKYIRLREAPYPEIQVEIEKMHREYDPKRSPTWIEQNGPGEAVAENLDLRKDVDWFLFKTTGASKPKMIEKLQVEVEQKGVRWNGEQWPQLSSEMKQYQVPDDTVIQDSVMSLGIAVASADSGYSRGSVGKIGTW